MNNTIDILVNHHPALTAAEFESNKTKRMKYMLRILEHYPSSGSEQERERLWKMLEKTFNETYTGFKLVEGKPI